MALEELQNDMHSCMVQVQCDDCKHFNTAVPDSCNISSSAMSASCLSSFPSPPLVALNLPCRLAGVADAHLGIQSDLLLLLHAAAASHAHSDGEVPILRIFLPALPQSTLENKWHPALFWYIVMLKMRLLLRVLCSLSLLNFLSLSFALALPCRLVDDAISMATVDLLLLFKS
jgi:hypothetical protein